MLGEGYPPTHFEDVAVECFAWGWAFVGDEIGGREVADYDPEILIDVVSGRFDVGEEDGEDAADAFSEVESANIAAP